MTSTVFIVITVLALFYSQSHIRDRYTEELLNATSQNIAHNYKKQTVERVRATLNYLVDATVEPMYFFDLDGVKYVVEPVINDSNIRKVAVFDNEGKFFFSSDPKDRYGQPLNAPSLEMTVLKSNQPYSGNGSDTLTLAAPLSIQDKVFGGVVIVYSLEAVTKDIERHQALVVDLSESNEQLFIKMNILVLVIILSISLFLSLSLANRLITPIYELVAHSKRLQAGQYGAYNRVSSNDELEELAESINYMDHRLEQRTAEIEFMAFHDSLTKVPNRVSFINYVQQLVEGNNYDPRQFSVLFIDLDGFKNVNDNLGHQAGDELLRQVSARIDKAVRRFDESNFVARVGGDEFLACVHHTDPLLDVNEIAEQLLTEIYKPIKLMDSSDLVYSGASIGISTYGSQSDASDAEHLIKQADIAMYAAKAMGKGCFTQYSEQLELSMKKADELERDLKLAMKTYQDFQVWYQPQIALGDGSIVGYEALLRWNHPQKGFISPVDFIPVAESTGLIIELGKWVFNQVLQDIASSDKNLSFSVSVNVSAKQLRDEDLVSYLTARTNELNVRASRLQVEVTETALMENWRVAQDSLNKIRNLGIEVWLDDFGTGYASLSYLQRLEVDGLKVDRSFVSGEDANLTNDTLCSAIISMAKKLEIKVVAEGVETSQQADFLKNEQCDYAQGYYYSRPVPFDQLRLTQRESTA